MNPYDFSNERFPSVWSVVQPTVERFHIVTSVCGVITWVEYLRGAFLSTCSADDSTVVS